MSAPMVHPLHPRQLEAVAPEETVWLSASAGTGKTQVLSSRVLRLLLQPGVEPSQLLCLTFTKAGAAEMAGRIADKLAGWVRLEDALLARELQAIGARFDPDTLAHARTLFAAVLDCPGGGLRIDTIHAFAQWLLGAFPQEAGLTPGTRPMEDRERALLSRQVLADLLLDAEATGREDLIAAAEAMSLRMGAEGVERFLMRCAEARAVWFGPGSWQEPLRARVLALLDLPTDADAGWLEALCSDAVFDEDSLECCLSAYNQWNGVKGQAGRAVIADWLAAEPAARLAGFDELFKVLFTQKDTLKDVKSLSKFEEHFEQAADSVLAAMIAVRERRGLLGLAERLVPALTLGRAFALAWDEAKTREGLVDFDDQIRRAAALLGHSDYAEWIGYKLDRRFDHILVDEAQDTNAAQWAIIDALTREFFSGLGQRGETVRTLFVVGDYKQAIFGFQGTSPENFEAAREQVKALMRGAETNLAELEAGQPVSRLRDLGLGQSFRTAQPVLDFVDQAIAGIGHEAFGLDRPAEPHSGLDLPGQVTLWKPVGVKRDETESDEPVEDDGEETWLPKPERDLAEGIAKQVRHWLDTGFPLVKGRRPGEPPRAATAGDVMVLVRKRGDLAALIVARLHAHGVPVAGVDRLRLGAPLAVRDLIAALRFAAQPFDDLNLACLLVSPLIGWSQEQLLEHGYRDKHVPLWSHLRRSRRPDVASALAQLGELLALADYQPPQALLHWLLVGPWDGRRRLVARLGREANDPIDELLNAADAYAATATPSLVGFLQWFDAGDGELKREADNAAGLVRVMTVHGAKGRQAPIVILADAAGDPARNRGSALALPDRHDPDRKIPLPSLGKEERAGIVAEHFEAQLAAEQQEHWRLLYVAMTRAEEALFVGGALSSRDRGEVPEKSWYAALQALFGPAPEWREDALWGRSLVHGEPASGPAERLAAPAGDQIDALPAWVATDPPPEARPPRPLAPSALGEDLAADPPYPPGNEQAAARGVLLHRLLERLPDVPVAERKAAAEAWLARHAKDFAEPERVDMVASALAVLAEPAWAELFSPASLAEVPIAATLGGQVVAGTIDRLLIMPDRIRLVDFKTARRPPAGLDQVPVAILRQMAAYVAALEVVYPGRVVEAALLYTEVPVLMPLPGALLAPHKQALLAAE
jgi:ATP-dependent helicase/nuclease subunit A